MPPTLQRTTTRRRSRRVPRRCPAARHRGVAGYPRTITAHRSPARRDNNHLDIDYALAGQIVDLDGRPRQLRFRRDDSPPPDVLSGTGQLIAVVTDRDDTIATSRPGVAFTDTDSVLAAWQDWATMTDGAVNLAEIQRRIHAARLNYAQPITR